jgi:hypothetical protein
MVNDSAGWVVGAGMELKYRKGLTGWMWFVAVAWPLIAPIGLYISGLIQHRPAEFLWSRPLYVPGGYYATAIMVFCYLFFITMAIIVSLGRPDVVLDDQRIETFILGVAKWRSITWQQVIEIEIDCMPNMSRGGTYRFVKIHSTGGTINADNYAPGFDLLLAYLKRQATHLLIPIKQRPIHHQ